MNKLKVLFKVLFTKDWFIVSTSPKDRPVHLPFTLWHGDVSVTYHSKGDSNEQ